MENKKDGGGERKILITFYEKRKEVNNRTKIKLIKIVSIGRNETKISEITHKKVRKDDGCIITTKS